MDRSVYRQQWEFDPEQHIPADAPKPWLVAGYDYKAVNNVLRTDYLATCVRHPRSVYAVPGGEVTYVAHPDELRGSPHGSGTLFVLWGGGIGAQLSNLCDEAARRGIIIRSLPSGPRAKQEP